MHENTTAGVVAVQARPVRWVGQAGPEVDDRFPVLVDGQRGPDLATLVEVGREGVGNGTEALAHATLERALRNPVTGHACSFIPSASPGAGPRRTGAGR